MDGIAGGALRHLRPNLDVPAAAELPCPLAVGARAPGQAWERRMNEELKPLGRTLQRIERCPGKVATPGTECCVATGRPELRSVHRECNCLVIEPRKTGIVGAAVVCPGGRSTVTPYGLSVKVPPGSKSGAGCTREVRQEPGRSPVSCVSPVGHPVKSPGSTVPRAPCRRERTSERDAGNRRVKETKHARNGRREVGAAHGTDEAGEPVPLGPGGGTGRAGTRNRWRAR